MPLHKQRSHGASAAKVRLALRCSDDLLARVVPRLGHIALMVITFGSEAPVFRRSRRSRCIRGTHLRNRLTASKILCDMHRRSGSSPRADSNEMADTIRSE